MDIILLIGWKESGGKWEGKEWEKTSFECLNFVDKWMEAHIQDSISVLKKPLIIGEFWKSTKLPGYSLEKRNNYFQRIYNAIYNSARSGGSLAGGLFWQLLSVGMDNMGDGYQVILEQSPSTANIIAQQSHKLSSLT
ncbi:hypothetical protein REPUB_Repub17cG0133600 [Reevesia pubescens]